MNALSHSKKNYGIQYLRGIAAILVVLSHINGMSMMPKYFNFEIFKGWLSSSQEHVDLGIEGVHLFFVISGFIMTYTSLEPITLKPRISTWSFLQKRFIRIIPFMWFGILLFAVLRFIVLKSFPIDNYWRALTLFPIGNLEPKQIWTLRHEFLFYCIFCFTLITFERLKPILLLWFLSPILASLLKTENVRFELLDFLFSKYNLLFAFGYFSGYIYLKGFVNKVFKFRFLYFVVMLMMFGEILIIHYFRSISGSVLIHICISGLVSALIILACCSLTIRSNSFLHRTGLLLGNASYSIYLTHGIFISGCLRLWSSIDPAASPFLVLIVVTTVCIVVGIGFHLFIEKNLINYLNNMKKRRVFILPL